MCQFLFSHWGKNVVNSNWLKMSNSLWIHIIYTWQPGCHANTLFYLAKGSMKAGWHGDNISVMQLTYLKIELQWIRLLNHLSNTLFTEKSLIYLCLLNSILFSNIHIDQINSLLSFPDKYTLFMVKDYLSNYWSEHDADQTFSLK